MNRPLRYAAALLTSGLLLAGCAAQSTQTTVAAASSQQQSVATTTSALSPDAILADNADYTVVNEDEWSDADAVDVQLQGSTATSSATGVTLDGSTLTISEAGVYRLSGSFAGQVVVAAPDDAHVVLLLDGVDISNTAGSAIHVVSADDVAIHLATGSVNQVSDATTYVADAEANAAIYADTDLTISGTGSLTVKGNGNDGITSTDDLVILSGTVSVTAADDALRGKDALVVTGGTLNLKASAGDGMKSDGDDDVTTTADIDWTKGYVYVSGGTIAIEAGDDGIQAFTDAVIAGGSITAAVTDDGIKGEVAVSIAQATDVTTSITITASTEGIEAANIGIAGGRVTVTADDDGINASGNAELQARMSGTEVAAGTDREADTKERLEISDGVITVNAGADGLDSNGSVTITGGQVTITSQANGGEGPIDANGAISVAAGTVIANGQEWDDSMATANGPGGGPGGGGQPPQGGQAPPS